MVDFEIIAEGEGWLLVNKSAPLLVHPTKPQSREVTLLGGLEHLLAFELANGGQVSLINRLDRETSGLVLVATRREKASELGKAMERREISKRYLAILVGKMPWQEKEVDLPICRKGEVESSDIWLKQMPHATGRACRTIYRVLEYYEREGACYTLVEARAFTGRLHQVRVHAASMGHALLGDKIYGEDERCYLEFIETGMTEELQRRLGFARHALHASSMTWSDGEGEHHYEVGLPRDMKDFLATCERV